jgi:hypothetical protein
MPHAEVKQDSMMHCPDFMGAYMAFLTSRCYIRRMFLQFEGRADCCHPLAAS